jgi:hypothetical protein
MFKKLLSVLMLLLPIFGCRSSPDKPIEDNSVPPVINLQVKSSHPDFNDNGTLNWHRDIASGIKSGAKYILVDIGRLRCGNCKTFIEKVIPANKDVLLANGVTGVAIDADSTSSDIAYIIKNMPNVDLLPIVALLDNKGVFLGGLSGSITNEKFNNFLRSKGL